MGPHQKFIWKDVHPGDTIVISDICTDSSFQIVVRLVKDLCPRNGESFAHVYGMRLTSKGKPSRMPASEDREALPGERREWILAQFITEIRKPAVVTPAEA